MKDNIINGDRGLMRFKSSDGRSNDHHHFKQGSFCDNCNAPFKSHFKFCNCCGAQLQVSMIAKVSNLFAVKPVPTMNWLMEQPLSVRVIIIFALSVISFVSLLPILLFLLFLSPVLLTYLLPTTIAFCGKKRNGAGICLINLLFGWTVIGWIVAFIWACVSERQV